MLSIVNISGANLQTDQKLKFGKKIHLNSNHKEAAVATLM